MTVQRSVAFCRPQVDDDDVAAVRAVLESGWLTTGAQTASLETEFAEAVGARHAVALSSCTAGLHVALLAAGVGPGDQVITTTYTFVATGHAIHWTGARPVLVDVDEETLNLSPEAVEAAITPRTKAIVPVHMTGLPCDMDAISSIAARHGLAVVEDAAQAIGSTYRGIRIGSLSDTTVFSLYATKNVTSGEGGVLTTQSDEVAAAVRRLAFFGVSKEVWERHSKPHGWQYDVLSNGFKYNIPDILSALARRQLAKMQALNAARAEAARRLLDGLAGIDRIALPREYDEVTRNWHLFPLRVLEGEQVRNALIDFLRERGIGTGVHYTPLHLFTFYQREFGYAPGDFPRAERAFASELSLPMHSGMTADDADWVAESVRDFFR